MTVTLQHVTCCSSSTPREVNALAFGRRYLAVATDGQHESYIAVYDRDSFVQLYEYRDATRSFMTLLWHPRVHSLLLAGDTNGCFHSINIDLERKRALPTLNTKQVIPSRGDPNALTCIAVNAAGTTLFAGFRNGTMAVVQPEEWSPPIWSDSALRTVPTDCASDYEHETVEGLNSNGERSERQEPNLDLVRIIPFQRGDYPAAILGAYSNIGIRCFTERSLHSRWLLPIPIGVNHMDLRMLPENSMIAVMTRSNEVEVYSGDSPLTQTPSWLYRIPLPTQEPWARVFPMEVRWISDAIIVVGTHSGFARVINVQNGSDIAELKLTDNCLIDYEGEERQFVVIHLDCAPAIGHWWANDAVDVVIGRLEGVGMLDVYKITDSSQALGSQKSMFGLGDDYGLGEDSNAEVG